MNYLIEGFVKALHLLLTGHPETFSAIETTLQVTSYSMAASLVLGIPGGFLLGYHEFRGKRAVRTLVDTCLALPTVLIGLLVYAFISRRGPLGTWGLLFTPVAIACGQTILALPIVVALVATAIEGLDRQLRISLLSLGARGHQVLMTSIWEARHGVVAAALTAYGRVLTEVGISMMVGGNIKWHTRTMTTAIALETGKGEFAMGVALGLVLLAIAFVVNVSLAFLKRRT
ncbi:tungstate transport system permease protein [Desulfacinum hydrothermale DSM 13146]|uniref:Tungstate transport system permease protein n=1 Tax=Desulfacinum hydrothermale DSM 13146 TaxID=1121390 RepID=A0A1W1XEF2_9BACT|nr:ABC transporter permease [Desulfacinum hydrothermale]SMC22018.1 tungstate transport system permease protein [Desulfacinum hydrothermale DSM 13146]